MEASPIKQIVPNTWVLCLFSGSKPQSTAVGYAGRVGLVGFCRDRELAFSRIVL